MSPQATFLPAVGGDVDSVLEYLGSYDRTTADDFRRHLAATVVDLASMPEKAALKFPRSRRLRDVRCWAVRGFPNYLIFFRMNATGIEVLAVFHGRRNARALLNKRVR